MTSSTTRALNMYPSSTKAKLSILTGGLSPYVHNPKLKTGPEGLRTLAQTGLTFAIMLGLYMAAKMANLLNSSRNM